MFDPNGMKLKISQKTHKNMGSKNTLDASCNALDVLPGTKGT